MALILRRAQFHRPGNWSSPADYDICSGELVIGRLYQDDIAGNQSVWKWWLSSISGLSTAITFSGVEASLDEAKAAIGKNWRAWLDLAKLKEAD